MTLLTKAFPTANPFTIGFFYFTLFFVIGVLAYLWPAIQITLDYFSATAALNDSVMHNRMGEFLIVELERIIPLAYAKAAMICGPTLLCAIACYRRIPKS